MKITCVSCELDYRCVKAGAFLEAMATFGPYQLFSTDILQCPGCGHQITRSADRPIAEHYQDHYADTVERVQGRVVRSWANQAEKNRCVETVATK